jgi:hypothetical protein
MTYPTKEEFVKLLFTINRLNLLETHVFQGTPYVFRNAPADYAALRSHVASKLGIAIDDITIIGSARTGFSIAPDTFGIPFRATSDIDVLIVAPKLFDELWLDLLRLPRSRFSQLPPHHRQRIQKHKDHIYWGWMWPEDFVGVSRSAEHWLGAIRSIGRIPQLAKYPTSGRLYRSWEHAHVYHLDSLTRLAHAMAGKS